MCQTFDIILGLLGRMSILRVKLKSAYYIMHYIVRSQNSKVYFWKYSYSSYCRAFYFVFQIRYFNSLPLASSFSVEHLTDRYESLVNEWHENTTGGKLEKVQEKILIHQDCSSKVRTTEGMKQRKGHINVR